MTPETMFIVAQLAKTAHSIEAQAEELTRCQAGHAFESALRRLDFPTRPPFWWLCVGSWPTSTEFLGALARVDGGGHFHASPRPPRYRTPLLRAFVEACEANSRQWQEGSDELRRRQELGSLQGFLWKLRDFGLWPLPKD
jgi:hypothetical protein